MKKFASLILAVLMLCTMIPFAALPASAESFAVEGIAESDGEIHWGLSKNYETLTIWGHGNMKNYAEDEAPWYEYNAYNTVKHLKVGIGETDCITRIGRYAFAYFYYLETIELGEEIEFIEDYAFYEVGYKSDSPKIDLVIPSNVFYIGQYAFFKALGLKSVNIKSDYDALPYYVKGETYHPVMGDDYQGKYFLNDKGNIKADGVYIQYKAFYQCYNMETLTIGNINKHNEKNLRIGYASFENCESLHTINFADSIENIGVAAFCDCYALRNVWYYGTEEEFKNVPIDDDSNWNKYLHYVIDGVDGRHVNFPHKGTYTYVDKDGKTATLDGTKERCWVLNDGMTELNGGWYIVNGEVDYGGKTVYVSEDTNILLLDHSGINTTGGIRVENSTLGIYATSLDPNEMGYISVTDSKENCAGIGGGARASIVTVLICGGKIEAHGGTNGAGIGCEYEGSGQVHITGGIISAYGGTNSAGIGCGVIGGIDIIIDGGTIEAHGGSGGAGIGGGSQSVSGYVTINGGTVSAFGGDGADGIGCGASDGSPDLTVNLNGGNISATAGGPRAVDIGGILTDNRNKTGAILSEGSIWIIVAVVIVFVAGGVTLTIVKKKKKPAVADAIEKEGKE